MLHIACFVIFQFSTQCLSNCWTKEGKVRSSQTLTLWFIGVLSLFDIYLIFYNAANISFISRIHFFFTHILHQVFLLSTYVSKRRFLSINTQRALISLITSITKSQNLRIGGLEDHLTITALIPLALIFI